jgi:hypothetical protein
MSDVVATPPPIGAASQAAWPFPRRLMAVITAPRALFEHLAERPSWAVPFVLLLLAAAVYVLATWHNAWVPQMTAKMDEQGAPEQAYEMITGNTGLIMYALLIPLFGAIVTLVYAACVLLVGGFLLGGRLDFRRSLSIVSHAGLVSLIALPVRILLANAAQSPQVTLGPGALLPPDQQEGFAMKFLAFFFQSFDVFTLWQTVLVGLGVSIVARVGLKAAMLAVFGLFVIFALFGAVVGAISGG